MPEIRRLRGDAFAKAPTWAGAGGVHLHSGGAIVLKAPFTYLLLPPSPLPPLPAPPPTFVPPHPPQIVSKHSAVPEAQGLFNPENDKDACGVGFVAGEQQPGPSQQVRAGRHWRPAAGAGACLPPAPRPCWQSLPNHRHVVVSACMPALPITVMCYPCSAVAPFGRLPATPPTCPPNLLIAPSSPPPTAELSKEPKRQTVVEALEMLRRMTHRGACGCETNTGGAAGPEFMDGTPAVGNPCIVAGWSPSRVPTLK